MDTNGQITKMAWVWYSDRVVVGDVIRLYKDECELLGGCPVGEYVVESARDSGGWKVCARKLDAKGKYCADNLMIQFHQCPGYKRSLSTVKLVRHMTRTFV